VPCVPYGIKQEPHNIKAIESFARVIHFDNGRESERHLPTPVAKYATLCRTNKLSNRPEEVRY
jgi:hypothetical protein